MSSSHPITDPGSPRLVGWREWIGLPGQGVEWLKAKIDTGAQTSSLHAFGLRDVKRKGAERVRFEIHPWQGNSGDAVRVELPVHDRRAVRSSSGHLEVRPVVLIPLRLLDVTIDAEVTLTRRDAMGFRMLIGREALSQGFLVDSAASYLGGKPPRKVRAVNRQAPEDA